MSLLKVINTAKKASLERGYKMYLIRDNADQSYGFTQEEKLFLYDSQEFIGEVDGNEVFMYDLLSPNTGMLGMTQEDIDYINLP